jgi:hypothetical protein
MTCRAKHPRLTRAVAIVLLLVVCTCAWMLVALFLMSSVQPVHFTRADSTSDCKRIEAETPKHAAAGIVEKFPGALIGKIKRWKAPEDSGAQIGGAA